MVAAVASTATATATATAAVKSTIATAVRTATPAPNHVVMNFWSQLTYQEQHLLLNSVPLCDLEAFGTPGMIKILHECLSRMKSHATCKMWNDLGESTHTFRTYEELRKHLTTNHNLKLQPVQPGRPPTHAETALRERIANLLKTVGHNTRQLDEDVGTRDRQRRTPPKKLTQMARQKTIDNITTILEHMRDEEQCLFDSCLLPVVRLVSDEIPDGERQSTQKSQKYKYTEIVYADLELLSTDSLERCAEFLLDRVEGYAAELNKPRNPNDPDDIEEEIGLFTYDQEAAEMNVHPKWLQHLERQQIGEDGQPCRVKNSKDCRGLVLDWVYGRIVYTMEKARASANRTLGCESLASAAQQAYEGLVRALEKLEQYEKERLHARRLIKNIMQMRSETAGIPRYQKRAAAAAAASGSSASSNGDTPAGQEAGPSTASTGSNEILLPPPMHPDINDEQIRTMLLRDKVLTNATIALREHELRTMTTDKRRFISLKIAKGEFTFEQLEKGIGDECKITLDRLTSERKGLKLWNRVTMKMLIDISGHKIDSAMEEREEATQARIERARREFGSIYEDLQSDEDDANTFNQIMDMIKEIDNKIEVAQAAITHQEQLLTNILCVDLGAEVSQHMILPYLQMRIETAALEHAAKKAAAAEADVLGLKILDDLGKENRQAAEKEKAKKRNEAKERKQKEEKEQRRAAEIEARHKAEDEKEEKAARCEDGEGPLATAFKAVGKKVTFTLKPFGRSEIQRPYRYEGTIRIKDAENGLIELENGIVFDDNNSKAKSMFFLAEEIKDLQVLEESDTAPHPEPSPMEDLLAQQASQIADLTREVRMLSSMVARNCMWCGKTPSEAMYEGTRLRSCKCDTARYCSSECQSNDWRTHKRVCLYYREKSRKKKASSGG